MKTNLAFMFGGRSVEHEVSVISAQQAMAAANKDKYNIIPIYITKQGDFYTGKDMLNVESFKDIDGLLKKSSRIILVRDGGKVRMIKYPKPLFGGDLGTIDVVLPVIHGTNCEDGTLQGYLETLQVPYGGCNVLASALGMDKVVQKKLLKEHGVPVLDCEYFSSKEWFKDSEEIIEKCEKLGYPLIVKPADLGSSVGIKKAHDRAELKDAVENAANYAEKILVEHAIEHLREVNCAAMGDGDEIILSACEEPFSKDILTYDIKYKGGSKGASKGMATLARKVPAELEPETEEKIRSCVKRAFKILGFSGVARVDCMIDEDNGEVYVNEPNTIPGSLAFYLWEKVGISFEKVIDELVRIALKRSRERQSLTFTYDTNILQMQGKGTKGAKN